MSTSTDAPRTAPLPLLVLGRGTDLHSERGVECPGDLPAPSDPGLVERARAAKEALGDRVFVLGHHYQRDEVIEFADVTGDSFKLAKEAAARPDAPYIVFCGVHFMAESADILTSDEQTVILPDLAAGCSMADMAAIRQVEDAWDDLVEAGVADRTVPVTYMNSSAAIKAFTGRHGGTICTSSNAKTALTWALEQAGEGGKVLFLPDQHLGRNTFVRDLGGSLDGCVVFDPHKPMGGLTPSGAAGRHDDPVARALLGARPVQPRGCRAGPPRDPRRAGDRAPRVPSRGRPGGRRGRFDGADHLDDRRGACRHAVGGRHRAQPRATSGRQFPEQQIAFLEKNVCYCSTMNRIDLPHLVWALESLVAGRVVNPIRVDDEVAHYARVALDQMLALPGETQRD